MKLRTFAPRRLYLLLLLLLACLNTAQTQTLEWMLDYGGRVSDFLVDVIIAKDGSYVTIGYSNSPDDGALDQHIGKFDTWIIKFDQEGDTLWQHIMGGTKNDAISSIIETEDGKFIVAGVTDSEDGFFVGNVGLRNLWIAQIDEMGEKDWIKFYGGSGTDSWFDIKATADGYVLIGHTNSDDFGAFPNKGAEDARIYKVDKEGNLMWQRSFGGSHYDTFTGILVTADGGYLTLIQSDSGDGDFPKNTGSVDTWIFRLDESGNVLWKEVLSGSNFDGLDDLVATDDGGYLLAGSSNSLANSNGQLDVVLVKIDAFGKVLWFNNFGGSELEHMFKIVPTHDGNFVMAGRSNSKDGDVPNNFNLVDGWVIKVSPEGQMIWSNTYGGSHNDEIRSVKATPDGDIVLVGHTSSDDGDLTHHYGGADMWIFKISNLPTSQNQLIINDLKASVFPNPTTDGQIKYQIQTTTSADFTISLQDINGRILLQKQQKVPSGIFNGEFDLGQLPNGLYFLHIFNEKTDWRKKVVVKK